MSDDNSVVPFSPAAGGMGFAKGAEQFNKSRPRTAGGMNLLKLDKTSGLWMYGKDNIEVEEGSEWVVDANSMCKGYVAWVAGQPSDHMAFVGQPDIDPADLPPTTAKQGWQDQVGFGLICLDGEDKDEKVMYKTNTMGGIEAWNDLFDEMMARVAQGLSFNPILTLGETHYQHREHGTIYKPVLTIVGWMDADGNRDDADEAPLVEDKSEEPEPKKEAEAPKRRARRGR